MVRGHSGTVHETEFTLRLALRYLCVLLIGDSNQNRRRCAIGERLVKASINYRGQET